MQNLILKIKQNKFATVVTVILALVLVFVFGFMFLMMGGNSSRYNSATMSLGNSYGDSYADKGVYSPMAPSYESTNLARGGSSASPQQIATSEKKIVKQGSLSILVKTVDETAGRIKTLSESFGGSIDSINIRNVTDNTKSGSIVVRVPNEKFDVAMSEIKKLAVKVSNEQVNTTDVTAQYVDLESHLTNYRAVEQQYQEILKSAKNVEETLSVFQRLSEVRGNIESIQGQINYLSRQVSMSTISINMTSEADVTVFGIIWRPLTVLKQAYRDFLVDLTRIVDGVVIWIFKLPGILIRLGIFVAVILIIRRIYKSIRRRSSVKVGGM